MYPFQMRFLADPTLFRAVNKSTQIGMSFVIAAEGLDAAIFEGMSSNYVSVNEREAKDKIRYAKAFYAGLPPGVLHAIGVRLVKDTDNEIGFSNGARLLSLPASAGMRGRSGNTYLDEVAHYAGAIKDTDVYDAAIGRASREDLRLTLLSTPFGQRGVFYDVMTDSDKYRDFKRFTFKYTEIPDAAWLDKVAMIGRNMDEDSFEQEYQCRFVGDSGTYFSYALINGQVDSALEPMSDISELHSISGKPALYAGYDVGRRGHASVLTVLEKLGGKIILRLQKSYKAAAWDAQEAELARLLTVPGLKKLKIDETGMGMQLAEEVENMAPSRVDRVNFVAAKTPLAETVKMVFEKNLISIPNDRQLKNEIHSINKTITASGVRFDTNEKREHHADRFWSLAMGVDGAVSAARRLPRVIII